MAKTIDTESFIEVWEGERCLWYVSSIIYKKTATKSEEQKEISRTEHSLASPVAKTRVAAAILCLLVSNHAYLRLFWLYDLK